MNRLPAWFRQEIPDAEIFAKIRFISNSGINTVCQEAFCPNIGECFSRNQVTFMILGKNCTRHCEFCNVRKGPEKLDLDLNEPVRIAQAIKLLSLKYVVLTSVARDDLSDGGASQFVNTINLIRTMDRDIHIEVLIPDFQGNIRSLKAVARAKPFVLGHNLETVRRLYSAIRPQADYERSLELLKNAKKISSRLFIKSSLMLGLGETEEEVVAALRDLRSHNCDIVTLGQYLSPSAQHYPVKEFVSPELFRKYQNIGMQLGFKRVFSGPKVRSSYSAEQLSRELEYA